MASPRICTIIGCDKARFSRGWCQTHYARWQRHGDPETILVEYGAHSRWVNEVALSHDSDECLKWPFEVTRKGYGRARIDGKKVAAHRYVCALVNGSPPTPKHHAAHSCGKGHLACVNPKHLRWATPRDNHADKFAHGTIARGSRNGNASMDEATARSVKRMIGTMTQQAIADSLGITRSAVRDIKIGKTWAWLGTV